MTSPAERARLLISLEPNARKKRMLQEHFEYRRPSQIIGLLRLLQGNASLHYQNPSPNHRFDPVRDLARNYGHVDDWYFLTGILESSGEPAFSYTLSFTSHSLGSQESATECAQLVVTSLRDSQVRNQVPVCWPASEAQTTLVPFRFESPDHSFRLESRGDHLFPLHVHLETEQLTADLVLDSPFGETVPLFHFRERPTTGYLGVGVFGGWVYYSYPQLRTTGRLRFDQQSYEVTGGRSWMDRQTGTVGPPRNRLQRLAFNLLFLFGIPKREIAGWLWLCVMLQDQTSLALGAILWAVDGRLERAPSLESVYAVIQHPDGRSELLSDRPLKLDLSWSTAHGETLPGPYVSTVRIRDAHGGIDLLSSALLPDCLSLTHEPTLVPVAESPTRVTGTLRGRQVEGCGFIENVGAIDKEVAIKFALDRAEIPCTAAHVAIMASADVRTWQRRAWTTVLAGAASLFISYLLVTSLTAG